MSQWNSVWLQHRPGPTPTPSFNSLTPRAADKPLSPEAQRRVEYLQRPTKSSAAKRDTPRGKRLQIPCYMDNDRYLWHRMKLMQDVRMCTWTPAGTVKQGKKI